MSQPTFDDANLILRLYELRREDRMRDARAWFTAHFKATTWEQFTTVAPPGSDQNASFRMVVSYWEMVASFVAAGVLDQALFFQSGRELLVVWERVRDLLPVMRERYEDPTYFHNLERVGTAFAEWYARQSPGAYEAFQRRIRG